MNIEHEYVPKISLQAQSILRDGKTVQVDVYDDGDGRCI